MHRIVLALCLLISVPALAQVGPALGGGGYGAGGYGNGGPGGGAGGYTPVGSGHRNQDQDDDSHAGPKEEKPIPPPPAIPGAEPGEDNTVIPPDRLAAEMSPNEALFDAINRGDAAAAKDALNRGAQLDAKNVLGQTPTDAAIDLGRNDITFMLLSMRSGALAASRPAQRAADIKSTSVKATKSAAKHQAPIIADRGTPKPEVGFTGF